jgi:hypothetical protein
LHSRVVITGPWLLIEEKWFVMPSRDQCHFRH